MPILEMTGTMKRILTRPLFVGIMMGSLLAGCSTEAEKAAKKAQTELKQARADAEEAFENAKYPIAEKIDSRELAEAHQVVAASSRDGLNVQLGPMPASYEQAAASVTDDQTPAEPVQEEDTAKYEATCAKYLRQSGYLFSVRCAGRPVSGIARVEYSYPLTGTVLKIGFDSYQIDFKEVAKLRLLHGELVSLHGTVGAKTRQGAFAEIENVTVQRLQPSGTPQQLRLLKLAQLGELCLDSASETDSYGFRSKLTGAEFLKKGALHPSLANSGSVEVEGNSSEYNDRCIIENNKVKIAQRSSKIYDENAQQIVVWEDRGAVLAKFAAYVKQSEIDRAAELKARVDEYRSLSAQDKAARMVKTLEYSAEAIAEAIPSDIAAQGYLEMCNVAVADGIRAYKEQGLVGPYERAARACSRYASTVCTPERRTQGCKAFFEKASPVIRTMIEAQ